MNIELSGKTLNLIEGNPASQDYIVVSMTRSSSGSIKTQYRQGNSKAPLALTINETLTTTSQDFRMYHIMLRENNL
ncbi:MAG: hypothetical protein AABW82_03340 [Nanoarchaeota archaeon]